MSWFTKGFSALAAEEERLASGILPNSFWVPIKGSKELVFIDDEPTCIMEHEIRLPSSKFPVQLTCVKDEESANPICCIELGHKNAYLVGYHTIIDCSPKKDPTYAYELQFFAAKRATLQRLNTRKEKKGSYTNIKWEMSRLGEKSPKVGDEMENIAELKKPEVLLPQITYRGKKIVELIDKANKAGAEEIAKLRKTFQFKLDANGKIIPEIPVFNYQELLKPRDPKTLNVLLKSRVKDAYSFGTTQKGMPGVQAEDDIPF